MAACFCRGASSALRGARGQVHLGKREAFHEGRYSDLDKTAAAERQRGKAREAELCDNLAAEKARAAASEGKLATAQKALQDSTAQVKRLQLEAAASKSHSVIQEVVPALEFQRV